MYLYVDMEFDELMVFVDQVKIKKDGWLGKQHEADGRGA